MQKEGKKFQIESDAQLTRIAANFFQERTGGEYSANDVAVVKEFFNYVLQLQPLKKYKVALCFICINPNYWEFMPKVIEGAKKFFLPGHKVDYFVWSDLPDNSGVIKQKLVESYLKTGEAKASVLDSSSAAILMDNNKLEYLEKLIGDLVKVRKEVNFFEIESVEWPLPTLFRYHTLLQQEERLREYDYIFYCDIDMLFVNYVGDEILGENSLTLALHPMYALRENFWFPYDANPKSEAYIKLPGSYIIDDRKGGVKFRPEYYAGGFQGGTANLFIKAMKEMGKMIDSDFEKANYIPRWNDESILQSYLFRYIQDHPEIKKVVLSPAYVYPDSLIQEYYIKVWGKNYSPKIITLTKRFSVSKEGGEVIREQMKTL